MTAAEIAEFNRKAAQANQWARDAEARRAQSYRHAAPSPLATLAASAAVVSPAAPIAPRPQESRPLLDPDEAAAARVLAAHFGHARTPVTAEPPRNEPEMPVDADEAVARRILATRFGDAPSAATAAPAKEGANAVDAEAAAARRILAARFGADA